MDSPEKTGFSPFVISWMMVAVFFGIFVLCCLLFQKPIIAGANAVFPYINFI